MQKEEEEIRVNLVIDKQTHPLFFEFIKEFPKRKRATIIRNLLENLAKERPKE